MSQEGLHCLAKFGVKVAYICCRRGVTWTMALHLALESVGVCMAAQRGKVLDSEKWMERAERVTQLKWALQWRRGHSWTNAGHLYNKAEEHLHPHRGQKERGKEQKKHIHMRKHNPASLSFHNDALSTILSPPFLSLSIKPLSTQTAELPSVTEKSVSLYLTDPTVTFWRNNIHMQRGGGYKGQGTKWR